MQPIADRTVSAESAADRPPQLNRRAFLAGAAIAGGLLAVPVPVGASHTDVTLGRNRTFYDTDVGYAQPSASGRGWNTRAGYGKTSRSASADAYTSVVGSRTISAWVGRRFTVGGRGSRSARITMYGRTAGYTEGWLRDDSASITAQFRLKDLTTGKISVVNAAVARYDGNNPQIEFGGSFARSQTVTLVAGHVYRAYLYVIARAGRKTAFTYPSDWEDEKYFPTASGTGWIDRVTVRF